MIYILYCILIILLAYLGGKPSRASLLFRIMAAILYICIVGFRHYSVGVDSERYMEMYYSIPSQNYQWIEIGFDKLVRLLYDAGFSYTGLFLACIILTTIPMFCVLEKSRQYTFSAILLYIFTLSTVTNGMRQCISVALFFGSTLFILSRKKVLFFICISLALLFHYSSIILLPLYFIANRRFHRDIYIFLYAISFIFCFFDINSLIRPFLFLLGNFGLDYSENYEYYAYNFGSLSLLGFLYNTIVNCFIFYMMMRSNSHKKYPMLTNFVSLSFVLKNFAFNMPIMGRIILYFSWFEYLLIPLLVHELFRTKILQRQVSWIIIALLAIGFVHNLTGSVMKMTPYMFNFNLMQ